jgi:hypothetical protein
MKQDRVNKRVIFLQYHDSALLYRESRSYNVEYLC